MPIVWWWCTANHPWRLFSIPEVHNNHRGTSGAIKQSKFTHLTILTESSQTRLKSGFELQMRFWDNIEIRFLGDSRVFPIALGQCLSVLGLREAFPAWIRKHLRVIKGIHAPVTSLTDRVFVKNDRACNAAKVSYLDDQEELGKTQRVTGCWDHM